MYLVSTILAAKQCLFPLDIVLSGGIVCFPITYILSDVFSECYGYKWSRMTCYMGFALNLAMILFFSLAIVLPHPDYWGNQEAFKTVLGSTPRIAVASLIAFVVGDFANDKIFQMFKKKHDDQKGFALRAIISSLAGNVVDSLVFLPFAFYGLMPIKTLLITTVFSAVGKTLYETLMLPATNAVVKLVYKAEGRVMV